MSNTKKRILIIDPNSSERKDVSAYLKREDFYVETGGGLKEAVEKLSYSSFDYLIMDVNLPEIKGYEAVSIIKRIDPKIKVIMTAKKNTKNLETKIRKQDIFYYFLKSYSKEELKMAINNVFN